jgi:hypothetical protein
MAVPSSLGVGEAWLAPKIFPITCGDVEYLLELSAVREKPVM